ncbi:O-antigen ligase family protein [Microbacterium aurum]
MTQSTYEPVAATDARGESARRRWKPAGMLTVFIVLLFAVPSNITIAGMGTLGRPALLWGLILILWWVISRLQSKAEAVELSAQPVRWALGALVIFVLIGSAAALLRGQPADQVSPILTALLRLASGCGVVLVAMDGIRTHNDVVRLARILVIAIGCSAVLGLAQVATGSSLLDWIAAFPGLQYDWGGIDSRGVFVRASGTSTHPLEFIASLSALLPLAIVTAVAGGFDTRPSRRLIWWAIVVVVLLTALTAVARSAIIGVALGCILVAPVLPRAYRWGGAIVGVIGVAGLIVAVPGMWRATISLFTDAENDPSAQSRTGGLERLPDFMSTSPFIGQGWGTFTSRYYVFDNQWAGLLVEIGVLGTLALLALVGCGIWSAVFSMRSASFPDTRMLSGAFNAGLIVLAVLFAFFDGFSFPIATGLFFLLVGLTAAIRGIALSDEAFRGGARQRLPRSRGGYRSGMR